MNKTGRLIIGAVPIGDFKDASLNLIDYIVNHKIIVVESLEPFKKLCKSLNIDPSAKIINYGSYDNKETIKDLIKILQDGVDVLFLSDEGTAGMVDPGGSLLNIARNLGIVTKVMAGPSCIIPSAVNAGCHDGFYFYGQCKDKTERKQIFKTLTNYNFPIMFFVTNDHLNDFILDAVDAFGKDRKVSIASNLTKENEFVLNTTMAELFEYLENGQMNTSITLTIHKA